MGLVEPPTHQRIDDDCQEQFAKQAKLLEVPPWRFMEIPLAIFIGKSRSQVSEIYGEISYLLAKNQTNW